MQYAKGRYAVRKQYVSVPNYKGTLFNKNTANGKYLVNLLLSYTH